MYIALAAGFIVGLYYALRKQDEKVQKWVLFGILAMNFALHFLKLAFPPYCNNLPSSLHKVTLENLCAISTVMFPFLFLAPKKSVIHDYIYFIGFMGGFLALVYPTEALGRSPFVFESIRFYICHTSLIAVPLLSALLGLHRPRLKKAWAIPLFFYLQETMIMLNEIVLLKTGLINGTLESFLSRASRNNSFVHGPTPDMDGVGKFLTFFCPEIFKKDIFGINGGVDFYWPVIWLIIPVIVYFIPIYFIIASPVAEETREYFNKRKQK
ncbi:MAG: hypothetical protein ACI3XL_01540 [Eubacteriales bacterium]